MGAIDIEIGPRPLFERAARGIVPARHWHCRFRRFDEKARKVGEGERGGEGEVLRLVPDRQGRASLGVAFLALVLVLHPTSEQCRLGHSCSTSCRSSRCPQTSKTT